MPTEFAATLQRMGHRAEYVRISGNGPNALDFHIAFYVGQLAAADPKSFFHVISKDTGFDPLIQHLKAARPRTVKTLSSTIDALFQKQVPEKEIEALVKALEKRGLIAIDDKKVSYTLP